MRNHHHLLKHGSTWRSALLALICVGAVVCAIVLSKQFVLRRYDGVRLKRFADCIAGTDRVTVSRKDSSVRLTLTGDDAVKIRRALEFAASARMPDKEIAALYDTKATFYSGTNELGHIAMMQSLFLLEPEEPPFYDSSEVLDTMLYQPLRDRLRESYATEIK